jgi:hypothetical protein
VNFELRAGLSKVQSRLAALDYPSSVVASR